jgi:2'-5' RNA ligase
VSDPLRLFLAVELPAGHRSALARRLAAVKSDLPPARWVREENLHLTLAFLGDTDPGRVPGLAAAVAPAFAAVPRFESALTGPGTFPPGRPARVAWIGLASGPELQDLQRGVARGASEALGTEPEGRPFHPHVTVARPKKPWTRGAREVFQTLDGLPSEPFEVTEGVLYRSELNPPEGGGARYTAIERFALGAAISTP